MKSQCIELELRGDVLNAIDLLVAKGKFISRGDAIRHMVRQALEESSNTSSKKKPKQPSGPKKPANPPRQPSRPPQRMPQRRGR